MLAANAGSDTHKLEGFGESRDFDVVPEVGSGAGFEAGSETDSGLPSGQDLTRKEERISAGSLKDAQRDPLTWAQKAEAVLALRDPLPPLPPSDPLQVRMPLGPSRLGPAARPIKRRM